ncbi:MAG: hypothetical protein AAGE76_14145 [Pseudomonadota bacterium]
MNADTDISRLEPLIDDFVGQSQPYYRRVFGAMLQAPGYRFTLNGAAGLLGPIWFGARGLWAWFLGFLILETAAFIQIGMGFFGDLGAAERDRAESIQATLELRYQQIEAAQTAGNTSAVESLRRAADSLEGALADAQAAASAADATGLWFVGGGLLALALVKFIQAALANWTLEQQFARWRSNRAVASGWSMGRLAIAAVMFVATVAVSTVQFAQPTAFAVLAEFPTNGDWRLAVGDWTRTGSTGCAGPDAGSLTRSPPGCGTCWMRSRSSWSIRPGPWWRS